jgi:hypothetical protein
VTWKYVLHMPASHPMQTPVLANLSSVTEAATLRPPLAVRHLEEGDTRQLVDLAERHAGDVEGAHEVYPFADVGLLEYAAGVGAQFTDGIPNAGFASFAEPGGRGG